MLKSKNAQYSVSNKQSLFLIFKMFKLTPRSSIIKAQNSTEEFWSDLTLAIYNL